MSFDLANFARAVPNTSGDFDCYENNARRLTTAKSVGEESQARPGAIDHTPGIDVIPLPAPGQVLLFSGAQLHTSIPVRRGDRAVALRRAPVRRDAGVQRSGTIIRPGQVGLTWTRPGAGIASAAGGCLSARPPCQPLPVCSPPVPKSTSDSRAN